MTDKSLPTVEPPDKLISEQKEHRNNVHGVILAAGKSTRYGEKNKLLQEINEKPVISHVVGTAVQSLLSGTTIILGHEHNSVSNAIDSDWPDLIVNEEYKEGQSTSVTSGVNAAKRHNADAVLILLGDMPAVSAMSVNKLIHMYKKTEYEILAAAYDNTRGNPVLFDNQYFEDLCNTTGDVGGRQLISPDNKAILVETSDPGVTIDVNHPSDLECFIE